MGLAMMFENKGPPFFADGYCFVMGFYLHADVFDIFKEVNPICGVVTRACVVFEMIGRFDCICSFYLYITDGYSVIIWFFLYFL